MSPLKTHNRIEVSRAALLNNFDVLARLSGNLTPMPVLKSNAYGHGLEQVAEILQDRDFPYIVVNLYEEYERIRRVTDQPVLVLGAVPLINIPQLHYSDVAFLVQDIATIEALGATGAPIKVHVDIDTGMSRYGATAEELDGLLDAIKAQSNLELEGVASHLADADNPDDEFSRQQGERFDAAVTHIQERGFKPRLMHLSNSPGAVKQVSRLATAFRPGFGLYGVSPLTADDPHFAAHKALRPALRFVSTITKVRQLQPGDSVGYARAFKASQPKRIGVVPAGYYECLPRPLGNEVGVLTAGGQKLPILGRVCMNHVFVDLDGTELEAGDEVVVISNRAGDSNSVRGHCDQGGLHDYSLLANLSSSTPRIIVS